MGKELYIISMETNMKGNLRIAAVMDKELYILPMGTNM